MKSRPLINARSEGIESSRVFAKGFRERRCLVPASWYYEWVGEKGSKTVLKIGLKSGEPLMMAGLWERRKDGDDGLKSACTIITTESVGALNELHPRMPAILTPESQHIWLDPDAGQPDLLGILHPYPDEDMEAIGAEPLIPDGVAGARGLMGPGQSPSSHRSTPAKWRASTPGSGLS